VWRKLNSLGSLSRRLLHDFWTSDVSSTTTVENNYSLFLWLPWVITGRKSCGILIRIVTFRWQNCFDKQELMDHSVTRHSNGCLLFDYNEKQGDYFQKCWTLSLSCQAHPCQLHWPPPHTHHQPSTNPTLSHMCWWRDREQRQVNQIRRGYHNGC